MLKRIRDMFPRELLDVIYLYIPERVTIFLTKENYVNNHYKVKGMVKRDMLENYIRSMIRQDNDFVFQHLLVENSRIWINMKKYNYRRAVYLNYLYFVEAYCIENESSKCREKLIQFFIEQGLSKNRHKKNIVKYL
jgi:hypothetical protein